jgi:hypothetical protein
LMQTMVTRRTRTTGLFRDRVASLMPTLMKLNSRLLIEGLAEFLLRKIAAIMRARKGSIWRTLACKRDDSVQLTAC